MFVGSGVALMLRLGLLAMGASPFAMHVTTVCRADSLLLGGALAMLYRSNRWVKVQQWAPWGFAASAIVMLASILVLKPLIRNAAQYWVYWGNGLSYTVLAVGFGCLIACSLRAGSVCQRVFQLGWLRFLGKYSYGLYVLHVLILTEIDVPLRDAIYGEVHSKLVAVLSAGLLSIGLSIVAAYASYHLYEKPFLNLKHRFDYARRSLNHGSPDDAFVK